MQGYECIYDRQKQSAKFYVELKNVSRLSMCESVSQKDGKIKKAAPRQMSGSYKLLPCTVQVYQNKETFK